MNLRFEKLTRTHHATVLDWLTLPEIQQFWDNSPEHRADIANFVDGRRTPSPYCDGQMVYWLAFAADEPFALFMVERLTQSTPVNAEKLAHLSKTGHSYGLDYLIGNQHYFGAGYGARTLSEFIDFLRAQVDDQADTFLIDPAIDNPRAAHVYEKAGFTLAGVFTMAGAVSGAGKQHRLYIKQFSHIGPNQPR